MLGVVWARLVYSPLTPDCLQLVSHTVQKPWVDLVTKALGAREGDTLLLQHTHTDEDGFIHVSASIERGFRGEVHLDRPTWTASATDNCTAGGRQSDSACSDARGEWGDIEGPSKRLRLSESDEEPWEREAAAAHTCTCGKVYTYEGSFIK